MKKLVYLLLFSIILISCTKSLYPPKPTERHYNEKQLNNQLKIKK